MENFNNSNNKSHSYGVPIPINIPAQHNYSQNSPRKLSSSFFPASSSFTPGIHFSPPASSYTGTSPSSFPNNFAYKNPFSQAQPKPQNQVHSFTGVNLDRRDSVGTHQGQQGSFLKASLAAERNQPLVNKSLQPEPIQRVQTPMGKMILEGMFLD